VKGFWKTSSATSSSTPYFPSSRRAYSQSATFFSHSLSLLDKCLPLNS
jgi:hypothetical protein